MSNRTTPKENLIDSNNDNSCGPTRNRGITDCLFCLVMFAFWGFTIFLMVYGFTKGDPNKLVQTFDDNGIPCGNKDAGTEDYKFIFFYQPIESLSAAACIKNCPQWGADDERVTELDCFGENRNCNYDGDFSFENLDSANAPEYSQEPFLIYNTTAVMNRFCVVSFNAASAYARELAANITLVTQISDKFEEYFSDIKDSWVYFIYIGLFAFIVSIISLFITRYIAGAFVWIVLLLYLVACFGLAVAAGKESSRLRDIAAEENISDSSNNTYYTATNLKILSVVLYIIGSISTLIILFSLSTISLSIAVIKTAALFVASNFWIVLIPIIIAVANVVYVIVWIINLIFLWSVGEVTQRSSGPFAEVIWDKQTRYLIIGHFFALLWNIAFINYLGTFIIACACCIWYFNGSSDSSSYFPRPILTSCWWAFRYHLGSIAFGALILAIVWVIQIILAYVANYTTKLKEKGLESRVVDLFIKCLMCYVSCFERVIKFISKIGFIQVAISGDNFCKSCFKAMGLFISNPMKFGFVHALGSVFVFIGKLFVATASAAIGYLLITLNKSLEEKLYSKTIPVIVCALIGYVIALIFFSVYGISADAVLLCFFWSKENGDKSGRPVSAPEPMKAFYEKYKKN